MRRAFLMMSAMLFLSACSFNKLFLQPTKFSAKTTKLKLHSAGGARYVLLGADNHQPSFLNKDGDVLNLDYTVESVVFRSPNGNNLNGWMLKPKSGKPAITLLHVHGNAGSVFSQSLHIIPLLKCGFQIFTFDYSGFGFSEGKATRANIQIDANAALSYVKSRDDVKSTKLVLYGQSLGGHLAAVVAQQREADIDGLVIEAAFSSDKDIAARRAGFLGSMLVSEQYSGCKSIQAYYKPVLVVHSTADQLIPFKMGQKLFRAANAPKEFYEISGRHMYGPELYPDSIAHKIIRMLK